MGALAMQQHSHPNQHKETIVPTFDTPEPISVTLDLGVGNVRIMASDRTDTFVEVRPSNGSKASDVKAAEETRVDYSHGRLQVLTPKTWKRYWFFGGAESVDVTIELPAGSEVHGKSDMGEFRCAGRLGECRLKSGMGHLRVEEATALQLDTGMGDITVDRALGDVDVTTGSGKVRIDAIGGSAVVKNSNGDTRLGDVSGDVRVKAANGDIVIDRARASATAKTANGKVRIGDVTRGSIALESAAGELEIGIHEGSAAWLDLGSRFGTVHNTLSAADGPEQSDESVEVRARTSYGDIVIRRAPAGTNS
jgi:hypothetical protein